MKKLLIGLLVLGSFSALANTKCEGALHSALLKNHTQMEQPYTAFYLKINEEVNQLCSKNLKEDLIKESCRELCETNAEAFHQAINTRFRFSSKVKKLKSECKSLCNTLFE